MKRISIIMTGITLLCSCHKADLSLYHSPDNVYFDFTGSQRDSLLYTFAYEPARAADTIYLPVRLSGIRVQKARKIIIRIEPDSTTAIVNKDYAPLKDFYTLAPDSGTCYVPLIIYNTDPLLQTKSVQIKFKLYPTPDLDTALSKLITGRLVFSAKLERPDWWGMWMGDYYSQVKHQLFIIVTGQTSLTMSGLDAPKNLYFVSLLTSFLNDPFKWMGKNPDRGYKLVKLSDGHYSFYNTSNPGKKIEYQYDAQAGKYFFIDENGLEVN
ncbi:MAG TPA: DUF4843 domain-containing protein [Chitinophagaceae bacterium]|nr:DUF4843 domain-containing protein [Chitinophagaceae bacterium]